jgi:hypothetical protein
MATSDQHRHARMATTPTIHMRVRRMAIMARDGLQAASSSAQARGFTALTDVAMVSTDAVDTAITVVVAMVTMVAAITVVVAMVTMVAATTDRAHTTRAVAMVMVGGTHAPQSVAFMVADADKRPELL